MAMNETARMITGWIWILSALGISYKVLAGLVFMIAKRLKSIVEERQREQEAKNKKQAEYQELCDTLNLLCPKEKALLRYMSDNLNGAIWLPVEDATTLSLFSRKLIYPIWNVSTLRGSYEDGTAQCFLYVLSDKLKGRTEMLMEHTKETEIFECYAKYNLEI